MYSVVDKCHPLDLEHQIHNPAGTDAIDVLQNLGSTCLTSGNESIPRISISHSIEQDMHCRRRVPAKHFGMVCGSAGAAFTRFSAHWAPDLMSYKEMHSQVYITHICDFLGCCSGQRWRLQVVTFNKLQVVVLKIMYTYTCKLPMRARY